MFERITAMVDRVKKSVRETMRTIEIGESDAKKTDEMVSGMIEEVAVEEGLRTTTPVRRRMLELNVKPSGIIGKAVSSQVLRRVIIPNISLRGVPIVKTGGEDSSPEATKKDAATADALAKAKAAVEAEQKKEQDAKAKPTEAGGSMEIKEAAGSEETNGSAARKHEREEDDEELPVAKKADCKPGAVEVIEAQS